MSALISALLCFLFHSSLLAWTARLYQTPGWTNSAGLLFADRLVYALIMPGLGLLFFFLLIPRLLSAPAVGRPRFSLFNEGSQRGLGLLWAVLGALAMFGLVYILSELLQNRRESGGLAMEIRRAPQIGLFLVTTGIITPVLEELYYRGVLQQFLQRTQWAGDGATGSPLPAIFVQALCFGLVHAGNGLVPAVTLFVGGLGLGILYWRYGLASSILAHSFYNLAILIHFQVG